MALDDYGNRWRKLNQDQKKTILCLAYMTPPALVDDLATISGLSLLKTINAIEALKRLKLCYEKKIPDQGSHLVCSDDIHTALNLHASKNQIQLTQRSIVAFYRDHLPDGDTKSLRLAALYYKLNETAEGLRDLKQAAKLLTQTLQRDTAIAYYDRCLAFFYQYKPVADNAHIYLECVLGKVLASRLLLGIREQIRILTDAAKIAKKFGQWEYLARINFRLSRALAKAGQGVRAHRIICKDIELSQGIDNPVVRIFAAISMSQLKLERGRIAEALRNYEEIMGDVEEFGDDDASLMAGGFIGHINILRGRIARGMGMIEAVRNKAKSLGLKETMVFTNLIKTYAFLEINDVAEAEVCLMRAMSFPEDSLDRLMQLITLRCRSYILFSRKDYDGAIASHRLLAKFPRQTGYVTFKSTWYLEYLDGLEAHGYLHETMNVDSEIKEALASNNVLHKGIAYRFKAFRCMRNAHNLNSVVSDLKKSEKYLIQAGAQIDLARTRIALGNIYIASGKNKIGQQYHQKAWELFPKVDTTFLPKELLAVIPQEDKMKLMIDRIINVNESMGTMHDRSAFLEKALNTAMDFTLATQSAFLKLSPNGTVQTLASRNISPSFIASVGFKPVRTIIKKTIQKRDEMIFSGLNEAGAIAAGTFKKNKIQSMILMPARLGDTPHGYICLLNRLGGDAFQNSQLHYIRLLCSQISVGLSNIRMYQEMREIKNRFREEALFYKREMGVANPIELIVGKSDAIVNLKKQIRQVAPTDSSVLITGETGVGKELVAKAIHNLSKRGHGSFVPVNLSALPGEIIASELFGHEKGAFTGAQGRHKGRFEISDKGTIFFDEIGDLAPEMQVKLLRVLQTGSFELVGGTQPIHSDFRVISATNKDLQSEIKKGDFRQDLYYRLIVFPIHVPPLRERREDIDLLTNFFVKKFSRKMGKHIGRIPDIELDRLRAYHWPGNVRELEHFIERSVILSEGGQIHFSGLEYLPTPLEDSSSSPADATLAEVEKNHITKVLHSTFWKVSGPNGAAEILGLKPTTLLFRMKKLGIEKPVVRIAN